MLIASSVQAQNLFESEQNTGIIHEFTPGGTQSTFAPRLNYPEFLAFQTLPVPEPSALRLMAVGATALLVRCRHNFGGAQLAGMLPTPRPIPAKHQLSPHPLHLRLRRVQGIVLDPQHLAQLVRQLRLGIGDNQFTAGKGRLCQTNIAGRIHANHG